MGLQVGEWTRDGSSVKKEKMGWQLGERTRDGTLVSVEEEEDGMASGRADC